MKKLLAIGVALAMAPASARAAAIYSTPGVPYKQDFNGLPTDAPHNGNLETVYADGWRDDVDPATTPEDDISIPGWYLYHPHWNPAFTAGEGGFNEHQRLRMGDGSSATGAFWLWGADASDPEKALGSLATDHLANPATGTSAAEHMFIALRITNNTNRRLDLLKVRFAGEQWRDGAVDPNFIDSISLQIVQPGAGGQIGVDNWFTRPVVPSVPFNAPVFGAVDAKVNGNGVGRRIISHTFGVNWLPGQDLWIRWADANGDGRDDGLAIDDVEVIAVPEPGMVWLSLAFAGAGLGFRRKRSRR
jgi:hypothetical protein